MQEASDYVDHELLTNRFHVTHYAGCAVLFNKETFYPDISVKSNYLHYTGEACQIKSSKVNRNGSCKVFSHVPHFVDHL